MSYYRLLGLEREPFSTSPDPGFFYRSREHAAALARVEIVVRLKRGLSLVLGDVGTGKTTLTRTLLQSLAEEKDFNLHMILDPAFKSEFQFLSTLVKMFGLHAGFHSGLDYKEAIEKHLFQKGVEEDKTTVLLIDEGQKLSGVTLEVLRSLLNYETNDFKLLQVVILAQMEFLPRVSRLKNFLDRAALKYILNPLDEKETRELIEFRLRQAGFNHGRRLFTEGAVRKIYDHSKGYPRRIAMLCHNALESLVMRDEPIVNEAVVEGILEKERVWSG